MIIERLTCDSSTGSPRASARVVWEDSGHPPREVHFETDPRFAASLHANPDAFLLAAYIPAMRFAERRIAIDGAICPQLRDGLDIAARQLRKWYGATGPIPTIEPRDGFSPPTPAAVARQAVCMSGGADSLASLRRNRLDFPAGHPGSIRDLLFIHGFDVGGHRDWRDGAEGYALARSSLERFADTQGAELIPIRTNIRFLEETSPGAYYTDLFVLQSFAACLAACAHAFSPRITTLRIPSSHDVDDLEPLGSHPLLDANYSSASLNVVHDALGYSRMQKMRLIAEWPEGLDTLRVCADPSRPDELTNCGRCEKCLRTMVSLLILGKLEHCATFAANDLAPGDIARLWWVTPGPDASPFGYMSYGSHHFWEQLTAPLQALGRRDLALAIESKLAQWRNLKRRNEFKRRLWRMDERLLGGSLGKLYLRAKAARA